MWRAVAVMQVPIRSLSRPLSSGDFGMTSLTWFVSGRGSAHHVLYAVPLVPIWVEAL